MIMDKLLPALHNYNCYWQPAAFLFLHHYFNHIAPRKRLINAANLFIAPHLVAVYSWDNDLDYNVMISKSCTVQNGTLITGCIYLNGRKGPILTLDLFFWDLKGYPSIHFLPLKWDGSSLSAVLDLLLTSSTPPGGLQSAPRPARMCNSFRRVLGLPQGFCPDGCVWNTSKGRLPDQMPEPPQPAPYEINPKELGNLACQVKSNVDLLVLDKTYRN